jgi:SAM-dependent methyltransferase
MERMLHYPEHVPLTHLCPIRLNGLGFSSEWLDYLMAETATGLQEGRALDHQKYNSTVDYRLHQEERSSPNGKRSDAVPYIGLAIEELVGYFPDNARILCVGPRDGYEMEALRDFGFNDVFGVDISIPSVRWLSSVGLRGAVMDMHEMGLAPGSFDVVFSRHNLEHAHTPQLAMSELSDLLRPGGVFCIVVPKENPEALGTHHGHAFASLEQLVGMVEALPEMKCVAQADRRLNNEWDPEMWVVAVKGEPKPELELRDRIFTRVWGPLQVAEGAKDGHQEAIYSLYRKELRRRLQSIRPPVLEVLAEPGAVPTAILQMGDDAWRVPMADLPVWRKEVEGSFDTVLAAGIWDAAPDPAPFMDLLEGILSPEGILALVEPGLHPTGLGENASQGIRLTQAGLPACFPNLRCVAQESLGPEGSPFVVGAVWRKDGQAGGIPEIDPAFQIPFPAVQSPLVEFFGGTRPYLESFEVDFLRRLGPLTKGDVLFVAPKASRVFFSGEGLNTVRFSKSGELPDSDERTGGPYDTVISLGWLGESRDPRATVEKVKQCLRPGGTFIFGETCLAPQAAGRPLLWRFTRPALNRMLDGFHHIRMEAAGPPNGPLAYYGWAKR